MKKITLLTLIFTTLCSCNVSNNNDNDNENVSIKELNHVEMKYNNHLPKDEQYYEFIDKLSYFSANLSEAIFVENKDEFDNLSMSPFSIYMALSMLTETLSGQALDEILNALDMTYEQVRNNTKKLILNSLKERIDYETNKVTMKLDINNSAWIDNGFSPTIHQDSLQVLADEYLCQINEVDFLQKEQTEKLISDYIEEKTHDLIKPSLDIDPLTVMVLLNTLYFKDCWTESINGLLKTKDQYQFTTTDNTVINSYLNKGEYFGGRQNIYDTYKTFFTKTVYGYKLSFIVPNEGYFIDDLFTKDIINQVNKMEYQYVNEEEKIIYLTRSLFPSFDATGKFSLNKVFANKLDIKKIFDFPDLSKFTSSTDEISVSDIIHESKVAVNEKGIEAAAYTAILMDVESAGPDEEYVYVYEDFIVDRAFGFILSDADDNILFTGVVKDIE